MDEARRVIERLERIEQLRRTEAPAQTLLAEVRGLLLDGERWVAAERGEPLDAARDALDRCRERLAPAEEVVHGDALYSRRMPRYGPPDAFETPRFSGPRTFMRLPHVRDLEGVDVAVVGIPTDGAVVYRTGARFGPEGIRSASVMLRNYNPILAVDVVDRLSLVDWGDVPTVPGSTGDSLERSAAALEEVARAGVTTLCLGGDHTVLLAELRALTAVHGPLALIQLDAHHDLWDEYFGQKLFHGSVVRRALEEGLVDPGRSLQAGLRGSLTEAGDARLPEEHGIDALTYEELAALGPAGFSNRVRARVGDAPCFLSFDIDFVDPAYAPGTGTPEVAGPSSREALTYLRSLAGLDFRGFDCVEVSPPFDPAGVTAFVAANACFEMLSLLAIRR